MSAHEIAAAATGIVVVLGWIAHYFKKRSHYYYGFTEVCFAGSSAWAIGSGLSSHQALLSRWLALVAAAYIAARGLNNMSDSKAKRPPQLTAADVQNIPTLPHER
jgi:hypothetical protein